MEGRTIVRPDPRRLRCTHLRRLAFNGGPDNRPARRSEPSLAIVARSFLQWRAGQSSGQTGHRNSDRCRRHHPSMEGRTIVRPDVADVKLVVVAFHPSMEGRTIVRPDDTVRPVPRRCSNPSMEGRTIVRPDPSLSRIAHAIRLPFNGGPDNRPARQGLGLAHTLSGRILQWRAGQSSGQTSRWFKVSGGGCRPSMEGRTIVRPDRLPQPFAGGCPLPFNGGPDNRPARP